MVESGVLGVDAAVVTEVFGLECEVTPDPLTGAPMVLPRGRHHLSPQRWSLPAR